MYLLTASFPFSFTDHQCCTNFVSVSKQGRAWMTLHSMHCGSAGLQYDFHCLHTCITCPLLVRYSVVVGIQLMYGAVPTSAVNYVRPYAF